MSCLCSQYGMPIQLYSSRDPSTQKNRSYISNLVFFYQIIFCIKEMFEINKLLTYLLTLLRFAVACCTLRAKKLSFLCVFVNAFEKFNGVENRKNDLILIMTPEKQDKTSELSKHWSPDSTLARNEVIIKPLCPVN